MAEKRGKGRAANRRISDRAAEAPVAPVDPPSDSSSLSEAQLARARLRRRWELASVLNFLHVFQPLIQSDLEISAEEIETALITPNDDLGRLHLALLKGIPPVGKNVSGPDVWVTVVCKKLATWWPWVAEGENPLKAEHGEEIQRYKDLDPITRMLILKALCEVRAEQDDVLRYITDELKSGTKITAFRKERMGGDGNETAYWYDEDPVIGNRLYKEVVIVDSKQKFKGKGHATEPKINCQWETMATNLEEFREISDSLSSSKNKGEAAVGEMIRIEIVPVLEKVQQKKERAMKRQQRQALQLGGFVNPYGVGIARPRRDRKPVCYTFDEYDRSISEAIQISKKSKTADSHELKHTHPEKVSGQANIPSEGHESMHETKDGANGNMPEINDKVNGNMPEIKDEAEYEGDSTEDDNDAEDDDYDEKDEHHDESNDDDLVVSDDDSGSSLKEKGEPTRRAQNAKVLKPRVVGVRRSQRISQDNLDPFQAEVTGHAEMKKRLRQRPTRNNADFSMRNVADSENDFSEDSEKPEMVSGSEMEDSDGAGVSSSSNDE